MEVRTSSQESRWDKDAEFLSLPRSKAKITPDHGDNTDNDSGKKPLSPALVASEHRSRDLAHIRKIKHECENSHVELIRLWGRLERLLRTTRPDKTELIQAGDLRPKPIKWKPKSLSQTLGWKPKAASCKKSARKCLPRADWPKEIFNILVLSQTAFPLPVEHSNYSSSHDLSDHLCPTLPRRSQHNDDGWAPGRSLRDHRASKSYISSHIS